MPYFVRHHFKDTAVDESKLSDLNKALGAWLKTLDDKKGRRFVNSEKSEIKAELKDLTRLHIDIRLVFLPEINAVSVSDAASIDILELEFNADQNVWA